jgi:putative redox protein
MSGQLSVRHLDGDQFAIDIRGHTLLVDQPVPDGGTDQAPTPTELFIAGLASCVAFYARRYLARHELSTEGLAVSARFEIGSRPTRVTSITVDITPPTALPPERREAFLAVASHCTAHNSLMQPPAVDIALTETAAIAH